MSISGKIENLIRISWFESDTDNATSLLAAGHQMLRCLAIFKTKQVSVRQEASLR